MVATNFDKVFITDMKNYEKRILDAIDSGKAFDVSTEHGAVTWTRFHCADARAA
jgi:hypothetical protein